MFYFTTLESRSWPSMFLFSKAVCTLLLLSFSKSIFRAGHEALLIPEAALRSKPTCYTESKSASTATGTVTVSFWVCRMLA